MSQKILITGAFGHLGSSLVSALEKSSSHSLTLVCNHTKPTGNFRSLLAKSKAVKIIHIDLNKNIPYEQFLDQDIIIHLAAITNATTSHLHKQKIHQTNVLLTEKIAKICSQNNSKLLFPSTTSIYGLKNSMAFESASDNKITPHTQYAHSKYQAEKILDQLSKQKDLQFTVLRLASIFGLSQSKKFHTAINKFILQAFTDHKITIWKTAYHQKRPFLEHDDAVNGFLHIINHNVISGEVYNLATINTTVSNVVDLIKQHLPKTQIKLISHPAMNDYSFGVSTRKIKSSGFTFKGNLSKSIKQTVDYLNSLTPSQINSIYETTFPQR